MESGWLAPCASYRPTQVPKCSRCDKPCAFAQSVRAPASALRADTLLVSDREAPLRHSPGGRVVTSRCGRGADGA